MQEPIPPKRVLTVHSRIVNPSRRAITCSWDATASYIRRETSANYEVPALGIRGFLDFYIAAECFAEPNGVLVVARNREFRLSPSGVTAALLSNQAGKLLRAFYFASIVRSIWRAQPLFHYAFID